jgi:programmed cell death protein 5
MESEISQEKLNELERQLRQVEFKVLEPRARTRLNNVKLINKERYIQAMQVILGFYNQGKLKNKINDEEMKALLQQLAQGTPEYKIKW